MPVDSYLHCVYVSNKVFQEWFSFNKVRDNCIDAELITNRFIICALRSPMRDVLHQKVVEPEWQQHLKPSVRRSRTRQG